MEAPALPGEPLAGRIALVTGAGRMHGIGRGIVLELARQGTDVAVHESERPPEQFPEHERETGWQGAASVADEVRALGRRALAVACDVTQPAEVRAMADRVTAELGRPVVLVNNAAVAGTTGGQSLLELDDELWYENVDVNLNSVYLVTKAVAPGMLAAGGGAIVNVSSIGGRGGIPNFGAYCATKSAVIVLTQQLALELAPSVRVNCVCPGSVDTDMMRGTFARRDARAGAPAGTAKATAISRIPLGRQGLPSEIGAAVAFLVSDAASFITGQTLNVDGGMRMD